MGTESAGLVGRSQESYEGREQDRLGCSRKAQDGQDHIVSHRLPSGDAGDLHLQARAPFVTKINTRLTQDLEMPQRRLGRS